MRDDNKRARKKFTHVGTVLKFVSKWVPIVTGTFPVKLRRTPNYWIDEYGYKYTSAGIGCKSRANFKLQVSSIFELASDNCPDLTSDKVDYQK